ncbi:MAG: hypothetical protein LQ342_000560 [Letrouitia transgressa]|nr:MAG: hypothetical protein LQ342_000560 [Letrouitia transgressa]
MAEFQQAPSGMLSDTSPLTQQDVDDIWRQRSSVPESINSCIHDLFTLNAKQQPAAPAVDAWDGQLSYSQLDALASKVARRLSQIDTNPERVIPILFEKTKWTPVAMLGAIKSGNACVALDTTQPDARLRSIVQQIHPRTVVSSRANHARAYMLTGLPTLLLDDAFFDPTNVSSQHLIDSQLPTISPADIAYISFTSGTTGTPKGACISHANVRSAIHHQGKKLGFTKQSRVFDFAPYSFDVAWSNFLHTVGAGGCICIAQQEDMVNDLHSAITAFQATLINVTPTILRTINPVPKSLHSVLLSGEMPFRENIAQWSGHVRLLNTYGPTECTFKCAFSVMESCDKDRPDIGVGVGFCTWIVDPNDSSKLADVGSVGELYLEGPLVGQGYFSDLAMTASAFEQDPAWLVASHSKFAGRRGRLYKTGDLVRYKQGGRMLFIGRKDATQHKIRGQRVELGDVEHHARACMARDLPLIADVVHPQGSKDPSLALFVQTRCHSIEIIRTSVCGLVESLAEVLPSFMTPTLFIPIEKIPLASTGKTDRQRLRKWANSLSWANALELQSTLISTAEHCEPTSQMEHRLRQIWAQILNLDIVSVSVTDSFFQKGGDSVAAIFMVALARKENLLLTVADIFRTPKLSDLARVAKVLDAPARDEFITPFSLLRDREDEICLQRAAARLCEVDISEIEDIYPCTPLQEGMLAMTAKNSGDYISRKAYKMPKHMDEARFRCAWNEIVSRTPILRTRIVNLSGEAIVQVVLRDPIALTSHLTFRSFLGGEEPMALGKPLCRADLIQDDQWLFCLNIHHAIFDGWCIKLILDAVEEVYHGTLSTNIHLAPFQPFVRHVLSQISPATINFWQHQLAGPEASIFPSSNYDTQPKRDFHYRMTYLQWPRTSFTPSSVIRSATAILLASYTNSNNIIFGATTSGRQASVPDIEYIAGPTIATTPVRVKLDWHQTVEQLVRQIQDQAVEITEHEQYGLQRIRRISPLLRDASEFQLLLVVQPVDRSRTYEDSGLFVKPVSISDRGVVEVEADAMGIYSSYAMMVICQLEGDGLTLVINHDPGAIHKQQVHRLAQQLESLLQQLCSEECQHSRLCELTLVSDHDLSSIWQRNKCVPETFLKPVVASIDEHAMKKPDSLAISAWDKTVSYRELKELSCCLAYQLQQKGIGVGNIVLLSFEKSAWMAILLIAVLRTGATALPLSAISSTYDAQELMTTLQPKLAITSVAPKSSPFHNRLPIIHVSELVKFVDEENGVYLTPCHVNKLSDSAVILFTSGSTGAAKGVLWSHGTIAYNIHALNVRFGLTAQSRVFQFADYEYDVSNIETFATLSIGGCLCIPTGSDRLNRLVAAINDTGANWMCLTPSVAETFSPGEVPRMKTLVCAGEILQEKTALKWAKGIEVFHNWYGPAEAAVATSYIVREATWEPGFIGQSSHALGWLVDPNDHDRLAPFGAVAELCLEGPILAAGYIGKTSQALNQRAFVSPTWLQRGHTNICGRSGKIYKTGDLVKYDAYGRLIIIGRSKDSERKLDGRRVELGQIEKRVQPALSGKFEATVVAEIISPAKSTKETLALFIKPSGVVEDSGEAIEAIVKHHLPVDDIEETLLRTLPTYMIPKFYVPVESIPLTHAGKTDRRRLRLIGSSFTYGQLAKMQPRREVTKPSTKMEKQLQRLWAEIIGIEPDAIFSGDSFLQLGGDSIGAMRLVSLANDHGFSLTVADIFAFPRLDRMAEVIKEGSFSLNEMTPAPFSLLRPEVILSEAKLHAARLCCVSVSEVMDMYPCTALQEGLLAMTARRSGQYVSRSVLRLQDSIDPNRLRKAWQTTIGKLPILRTRVVDIPKQGLVQVVLNHLKWRSGADINSYLREDESEPMNLATELCRAGIVAQHFVLTIHHCLYDGNVLQMILSEVEAQYLGKRGMLPTPFQNFIQHLTKVDEEQAATFWRQELLKSELSLFPPIPAPRYEPIANKEMQHSILLDWPRNEMTPSTIVRSAWAVLAAAYTASDGTVFGATVSGRQVDVRGMLNCVGPTISSVPVAVTLNGNETVSELQARVQFQNSAMTPFEQYGLRNIQHAIGRAQDPLFQTLLVVQPVAEGKGLNEDSLLFKARTFASNIDTRGTDPFNTYAMMLICELSRSGLSLKMSYDDRILEPIETQRLAQQFENILRHMCQEDAATTKVKDLQTASDTDLEFFWTQNAERLKEPTMCVVELITNMAKERSNFNAVDAHDGQFSYQRVDELSNVIAQNLIKLGLKRGSIVALCLDKSKWTPVAQLAILKAGGICLLQTAQVIEKHQVSLLRSINVSFVLVLKISHVDIVGQYGIRSLTIQQVIDESLAQPVKHKQMPTLCLGDPAVLLLSSGSTGEPKQILWSHRTLAANVNAFMRAAVLSEVCRVFQFTSHNFDVCTIEMVATLVQGGSVCIPSESERLDSLAQAIQRFNCDFVCLTPSTAKLLQPEEVPCLKLLGFAGEKLVQDEVNRWKGRCRLLNWYGPCEHSTAAFSVADNEAWRSGVIGKSNSSASSCCWLVDPRNYNVLVPWGAIGEIAIEGPARAECYLENRDLTAQSFRNNPSFLSRRQMPAATLERNRIYLTGDLARCRPNGDLEYLRRKDTLFKIRGNLVAPESVEHHIRQCLTQCSSLEVVAEIITPKASRDSTLAAFLCFPKADEISSLNMEDMTASLSEELGLVLPSHSIPTCYIPIQSIPMTSTGKRDRMRLREIGASFKPLQQTYSRRKEPKTIAERTLREMWSLTLHTDADNISINDSFLQRGDSIQAMRLVGLARQQGLLLTVADIFQNPKLHQMAKCLRNQGVADEESFCSFMFLEDKSDVEQNRRHAASQCGVNLENVKDLYPCTPLQEGLLALSMKSQGVYISRDVMKLSTWVDVDRFGKAWEEVVLRTPILRTRIVNLPGERLFEAVIGGIECWTEPEDLNHYLKKEQDPPFGLGSPLMRCGLFRDSDDGFHFALTMHHSIYDGVTTSLILETLGSLYNGRVPLRLRPFQSFVRHIYNQDTQAEATFWKSQFESLEAPQFPTLPSPVFQPKADSTISHTVAKVAWRVDDFTPSTVIRAAWAIVCSQYTRVPDIVFGTISMGRKVPVAGIERIAGPTIAAVPIRVTIDDKQGCHRLLRSIQDQATEMIQYEHTGLSKIARMSEEAQEACRFQTMLVVQPQDVGIGGNPLFVSDSSAKRQSSRYDDFNVYALMVVCTTGPDYLQMEFNFDSRIAELETLRRMAQHFEQVFKQLCSCPDLSEIPISQISMMTDSDLTQCWKWNSKHFETNRRCVHEIVAEMARNQPNAIAVSAWDGEVSYQQLDRLSTIIACHLIDIGVERNMIVPLCFEKSMWMPIAFFSVVKAGAAGLLLDSTLPTLRLKAMLSRVSPRLILSSVANAELSSSLVIKLLILGPNTDILRGWKEKTVSLFQQRLPIVDPTDLVYVIFTSGSTGAPKGCMIQHQNFSSAMIHQKNILKLNRSSRVYDFSSYAFDASYWNAFHILAAGGTLCIPSDEERGSSLADSICRHRTTDIFLTPATARSLDPSKLSTLRNVYIGGEEVLKADIAPWLSSAINTFVVYGPTECSAISMYWKVPDLELLPTKLSIGNGQGVSTWIIDPQCNKRLSPIGAIGELYLEGPLVGQGYLENEGLTALSFLIDPPWLLEGPPDERVSGRRGRLYKTGDLVKYNSADGTILFVGRHDTQMKLRGQRIELSEVEHHVRCCVKASVGDSFAVVAEIIIPKVTRKPTLVIFLQFNDNRFDFGQIMNQVNVKLPEQLPSFMVPTAYISLKEIPMSAGRKVDRRQLQKIGADLSIEQLMCQKASLMGIPPTTESEIQLQHLWANVLDIPKENIHVDSSFLRLGADSIAAMKLASLARSQGIFLTVRQILSAPQLSEMAKAVENPNPYERVIAQRIEPFSLLQHPEDKDVVVRQIADQCGVNVSNVEDAFPCTGIQKELLSMTAKIAGDCIATFDLKLRKHVHVSRLQQAWEQVSRLKAPILRCRIVDTSIEDELVQVQIDETIEWDRFQNVDEYLQDKSRRSMHLAQPLTRLTIIDPEGDSGSNRSCLLTQHHAMYDGYSLKLLFEEVSKAYLHQLGHVNNNMDSNAASFRAFMKYKSSIDKDKADEFWRRQFSGIEAIPFPNLPYHGYQAKADCALRRTIDHLPSRWGNGDVTASTIIRAAWSFLAAQHTGSDDVIFGVLVTGRQAPIEGIERMIAPLIAALPLRITLESDERVDTFLKRVHQQSVDMIAYEQTEFLDIRKINADTEQATRFNTLLVVQPLESMQSDPHADDSDGPFESCTELKSSTGGLGNFNPHALLVMCQLNNTNNLGLELSFDSNVIDPAQAERIAAQFEHMLRQICESGSKKLEEIDRTSSQDLTELWKWNAHLPHAVQTSVQTRIAKAVNLRPEAEAICAWDGSFSYKHLDEFSDRLACQLTTRGAGNGIIIALCFEKSRWQPVAALGAIKAGAACVALDVQQPEERLRAITNQVRPKFVLSSANRVILASRVSNCEIIAVDGECFSEPRTTSTVDRQMARSKTCPSDILYVLFTSGSTGVPKGIVMTNEAFSSAVTHQAEALLVGEGSRVFDFVSYSFDITWSNLLNTLIRGGCLCIPSEWERMNDFAGAFNKLQANYVHFPPSVAASLAPYTLPGLKTLVMGGEPILNLEVARWTQAEHILGIYGPAECAQGAVSIDPINASSPNNHVGHPFGARFWLVQPGHPDRLAAIGAVGELLIEGPTIAQEYLGDRDKTEAAFIDAPLWLRRGHPGHQGRTSRLYKTGDLLRYNPDATFTFIGRKDGMIKLRGQRIELSEIECHIRSNLHDQSLCNAIAAEVIIPQDTERPMIVVFVSLVGMEGAPNTSKKDMQARLRLALKDVDQRLSESLPRYMLPGAYIPLAKMPVTGTNKINRRHLRELGNEQSTKMLAELQLHDQEDTSRAPNTVMEKRLQALWSSVLRVESSSINAESSFFRIGGESIAAMRLVAAARQQHISLTVADIFLKPCLYQLAEVVTHTATKEETLQPVPPFTLLPPEMNTASFVHRSIFPLLASKTGNVKDVLPTTAFQTQAILDALQDPPSRWPHWILNLPPDVDFLRLKRACKNLVDYFDILHTVFVHVDKFLQVQLEDFKPEFGQFKCKSEDLGSFVDALCEQDLRRKRVLGSSFIHFMAVQHPSGRHRLVFRISHAQFDGYSLGMLFESLSSMYHGEKLSKPPAFTQFMAFNKQREKSSLAYWNQRLEGSTFPYWSTSDPTSPALAYDVEDRMNIEVKIPMATISRTDGYSPATFFHAACCIVLSRHFQQEEIIIGRLVTGRSMLPSALQSTMGPCLSEIPIRMSVKPTDTLLGVAKQLHHQFIQDSSYEGLGMDEIIQQCTNWSTFGKVRDFGWCTAFQQSEDSDQIKFLGEPSHVTAYERKLLPRTRPEIYATPKDETLVLSFEGNRRLISEETARAVLLGLRNILVDR